ncbi:MAG: TAXI family TRAP transporter solute-binding subunit, partial [Candidatus Riflebacteria bacterium]|nr:TAXI family TRAP transporter solute-binding subunit [Candidatus Riflebacteria bacterium]
MIKISKYIFVFILLSLCSSFLYAEEEKYEAKLIKKIYSFGTASINGTYYPFGNAISRLFSKNLKKLVTVAEPTPGSVANVNYLRKKQIELALIQSDVVWMAYQGTVIFNGNPFKDLRVLASLYSEKVQIVVRADSGINSLDDLKGKKISVGEIDSGSAAGAIQILEAAGLK